MACSLHEVVSVLARSPVQPRIVLVTDCSLGGDEVMVSSELTGITDLRGRRVGVEAASLGVYILHRALSQVGLTLSDVKLVASEPTTLTAALTEKRIDAAVTYPPYSQDLMASGARGVFSSADIPGEILDVVVLDAAILAERPDLRERLDRVWDGVHAWIHAHPHEAPARMARHIGLSADQFLQTYSGMRPYDSATSRAALVPNGDAHRALQRIADTNVTLGLTQAVDLTGVCDG
jgi:NitT/TauT family transport system substrate-binding protein